MWKWILRLAILCVMLFVIVGGALQATMPQMASLPELKEGDLVFQTTDTSQTLAILFASMSLYSHVGIISFENGKPMVIEAAGPVRIIPLKAWIRQGMAQRITIKRLPDLSEQDAKAVTDATRAYLGKNYDYMFQFGRDEIYCSELIYHAFMDALQRPIGKVEKIRELNLDNWAAQELIKQRWSSHPDCQKAPYNEYGACVDKIMQQELITPEAVAENAHLVTIYSNYGPLK